MNGESIRVVSWNVNGIRSASRKGFLEWLARDGAGIVCLQETKAFAEDLDMFLRQPGGYETFWNSAERPGYSGVAVYSRTKPLRTWSGFGIPRFDREGRVLAAEYPGFVLLNIYFPNGKSGPERLAYKMDFYEATLDYCRALRKKGRELLVCGDYNTAHKEIDLARPRENVTISGFLPEERAWMDRWVEAGFVDSFRQFHPEPKRYSWWSMRSGARARNVGWRIDYHFVSTGLLPALRNADIHEKVEGSDHCPVSVELDGTLWYK